jgi:hypothetical protein
VNGSPSSETVAEPGESGGGARGAVADRAGALAGRSTLLRLSPRGTSLVAAAIRIGNKVERDLACDLGDDAAAHIRAGLERLAYDPPWSDGPPARARRVW